MNRRVTGPLPLYPTFTSQEELDKTFIPYYFLRPSSVFPNHEDEEVWFMGMCREEVAGVTGTKGGEGVGTQVSRSSTGD